MTLETEQARRYGGPADRRVGSYRSAHTFSRRVTDRPELPTGSGSGAEGRARALGWFSIGLGLAEVAAPRMVARLIGVNHNDEAARNTLFAFGLREITSGIGILSRPGSAGWMLSRVVGDAIDLTALGRALASGDTDRTRAATATAAVLGVTVLDLVTRQQLSKGSGNGAGLRGGSIARERRKAGVEVTVAITINRPRNEVYGFWRNLENLPRFMSHLESVEVVDERRSRWKVKAPAGTTVEWEAETLEDRPNELITWRSLRDSDVPNSGKVQFKDAPGNRGTEVIVELRYQPPAGKIGALVAKLFGEEPAQQVKGDLRRLKQVLEVGEVVHSDASIHRGPHPAQPPEGLQRGSEGGYRK